MMDKVVLPKFPSRPNKNNWFNFLISLMAYIGIGFLLFPNGFVILFLTLLVLVHEAGHLIAMRAFRYKDTGIFFIPLLGGLAKGTKREISQKESAIVLLAGPLPGILIGTALLLTNSVSTDMAWAGKLLVILNGLNLLPIYPLDGGQLFNRIYLQEEGPGSRFFKIASALFLTFIAIHYKLYPLLYFPLLQLWQLRPDKIGEAIEKAANEENINTDIDYQELPDEDYWKLRSILLRLHPACKGISSQTDQYDENEQRVQTLVESILDRMLIQDLTIAGKLWIGFVWTASLVLSIYFLFDA